MLFRSLEYMQMMGITKTQFIIVRHHNTDNPHCHIVYNRIPELLQSAVSAVLVTRQAVRLQLKNGQIIGKDDLA